MKPDAGELVHATCVLLDRGAVLLMGRSGAGKSDLTLRLIDRGAALVADDCTTLQVRDGALIGSAPNRIAGLLEVRGLGLLAFPQAAASVIRLVVDLDMPVDRFPEPAARTLSGIALPLLAVAAFEASAPIKIELALARAVIPA